MRGLAVLLAIQIAGCLPQGKTVRVAQTRDAPATLAQIRERADRLKLAAFPPQADDEVLRYRGRAEYSALDRSDLVDVSVRTGHDDSGAVVVATGSGDRTALKALLPEGTSYDDAAHPLGAVAFDIGAEAGWTGGPGDGGLRVDVMGHLGPRFGARPLDPGETAARATLAVLGGLGLAMQGDRAALRAAITASGAVQMLARPLPGRVLASPALALDLSAAVLTGTHAEWKAIEAGAALHLVGWGGPFVRVGREWSARGDGNTWMAGVKVGHEGLVNLAITAVAIPVVGYLIAKWPSSDKNLP